MKKKCRICKALGNNCAIGCVNYEFVSPIPEDILVRCKGDLELFYGECVFEDKFKES